MFRYLIEAVAPAGRLRPSATLKETSAIRRSATRTESTRPTLTPAMRTPSPGARPVASVNRAV